MKEFVVCPCGGHREHNLSTGEIESCDTCDDSMELARQRHLLTEFNRVAAPYLRALPGPDFDVLQRMFERGDVVIGGTSRCMGICPQVPEYWGKIPGRQSVVEDCNPWTDEEMAKGMYQTTATLCGVPITADEAVALVRGPEPYRLPPKVHSFLAWSWNYSIAEMLHEDTTRHNAQWIEHGIGNAASATDEELIRNFIFDRIDDLDDLVGGCDSSWSGNDEVTWAEVLTAMMAHPKWDDLLQEVRDERSDGDVETVVPE